MSCNLKIDFKVKNNTYIHTIIIISLIILAVLSRLLPHPGNFSPLAAIALFGATYFSNKKWAILVPMAAWWLSDLLLNNTIYAEYQTGFSLFAGYQFWSFLSILAIVGIGYILLKRINVVNVLGSALIAAVLFFVVSNFGVWLSGTLYTKNVTGLIECYVAAIPFFHWTLIGNIFYLGLMVGMYELFAYKLPQFKSVSQ